MASVEQLRLADDAPFADHGRTASNSTGSGRQQSSSLQARTPACPARSTASMRPASVRQPAVSYKEASSEDEARIPSVHAIWWIAVHLATMHVTAAKGASAITYCTCFIYSRAQNDPVIIMQVATLTQVQLTDELQMESKVC